MLLVALVQGQVIVFQVMSLLLLLVQLMAFVLMVLVKAFVVEVKEVFLSSPSSTPFPRTRPAARVWAWGAKGLGCLILPPAPGQPSSGAVSSNTAPGLVRHGVRCAGPVGVDSATQNEDRRPRCVSLFASISRGGLLGRE